MKFCKQHRAGRTVEAALAGSLVRFRVFIGFRSKLLSLQFTATLAPG